MRRIFFLFLISSMMCCAAFSETGRIPQAVPMDVAAFVDAYARGPVNKPTFVTNLAGFEKVYGTLNTTAGADNRAYLQVRQFFLNGGSKAWINRIVPPNWIGAKKTKTGIYAFAKNFNILVLPGIATLNEADAQRARKAALDLVTERDSFVIFDSPASLNYKDTVTWRDGASELLNQKNAAAYFPKIQIADVAAVGGLRFLGPSGSMAGIMTSKDAWVNPANVGINGALDLEYKITEAMSQELNAPENGVSINPIRFFPGRGILVWGARTFAGNSSEDRYIKVERTSQLIRQSVQGIFQTFKSQPNNVTTWTAVQSAVENFMNNLFKQGGALAGVKPNDAFFVKIGLGSTMTDQDIIDGNMRMLVGAAFIRPAEFSIFQFQQHVEP